MEYSNCHNLIISFTLLCQFQYKPNFHVCLFFINFCKSPLVCGGELMIVEWKHGTNGGSKIINVAPVSEYWISLKYFWFWKPGINKINLNVFSSWVCLCARQHLQYSLCCGLWTGSSPDTVKGEVVEYVSFCNRFHLLPLQFNIQLQQKSAPVALEMGIKKFLVGWF